ncbi:hypothetical protein LSM04_005454 [Trypanosoma melophagium]|uniref:uncharacterized protein n=1 Tax=Trypanosoma melophagium TaxID=715481 RepID=UPI003519E0E8|nr:hypothetical protein LSM04_005454 [Trypanosoma melophagium]
MALIPYFIPKWKELGKRLEGHVRLNGPNKVCFAVANGNSVVHCEAHATFSDDELFVLGGGGTWKLWLDSSFVNRNLCPSMENFQQNMALAQQKLAEDNLSISTWAAAVAAQEQLIAQRTVELQNQTVAFEA